MHTTLRRLCAALISFCILAAPMSAVAESFDVSAKVSAPLPPSGVPVITVPEATIVDEPTVEVTGTCYVIVPALLVILIRDNQTIGSGVCSPEGTFQITVPLVMGVNVINVKYMNITGDSGTWGAPLTLTYTPAVAPESDSPKPTSSGGGTGTTKQPEESHNTGKALYIGFDYDFVTYTTSSETALQVSIGGGTYPYKVFIGWGDGSSKSFTLDEPDTFLVKHRYQKGGQQWTQIVIRVVDAAGNETTAERALVTFEKTAPSASQPVSTDGTPLDLFQAWFLATVGAALIVAVSYKLFFPHGMRFVLETPVKQTRKTSKPAKRRRK